MRFKPATRVENACATGSAAIHQGLNAIAAGKARAGLVVGVEKMTEARARRSATSCFAPATARRRTQIEGGFAGIFGQIAQSYFQRYGDQSDALARIAAKNHKNGVANPLAQMQKDLGYEFCRTVSDKNPIVAGPLKRTDCSLVSDGAAAVVLADMQTALTPEEGGGFPRRRAGQRFPADEPARYNRLRRAGARLEKGVRGRAARPRSISTLSRRMTASRSPN